MYTVSWERSNGKKITETFFVLECAEMLYQSMKRFSGAFEVKITKI